MLALKYSSLKAGHILSISVLNINSITSPISLLACFALCLSSSLSTISLILLIYASNALSASLFLLHLPPAFPLHVGVEASTGGGDGDREHDGIAGGDGERGEVFNYTAGDSTSSSTLTSGTPSMGSPEDSSFMTTDAFSSFGAFSRMVALVVCISCS